MTAFWILVGFLLAVALMFVVQPLLGRGKGRASATRSEVNLSIYRDQLRELDAGLASGTLTNEQYQIALSELEARVQGDSGADEEASSPLGGRMRHWAIAAVIAVPLLTVTLYLVLGKPKELDSQRKADETQSQKVAQEQINAMVEGLAQKLKANPEDAEGWAMLGHSYVQLRRYGEAGDAYARAVALLPNNPQLLAEYADVLAMNNGRIMRGEPEKIIQQALKADPDNIKALALAGTAAFQRQEYRGAIEVWQKILKLVPADSVIAGQISANISQAQGLSGESLADTRKTPGQKTTDRGQEAK